MGIPKLLQTAEEVLKRYNHSQDDRECTGLTHQIDTSGSCQCGFFIDGEPSGSFPFVPNRSTRRRLSSFKRESYVKTKEDIKRMEEERKRDEARRKVRELARLSRREREKDQPNISVSLLVGAEARESEDG